MRDLPRLGRTMLAFSLALGACQSDDGGGPITKADVGPVIGAGFSAALRADLAKATGIPAPAPTAVAAAGNAPTPAATEPATAAAAAGDEPTTAPAATTAPGAAGDKPTAVAAGDKPTTEPAATTAAAATPAPGAAGDKPTAVAATPAPVSAAAATPAPTPAGSAGTAAGLPAELAAVTLTLNEGWVRDAVGPGTFSFFAPGEGGKNIRFVFHYAYEDATAPTQREPYKQWLASTKAMNVNVDRQRGAAWFLEGTDSQGVASFRYVITYGGRLLTCGGSLYKQGPAAGLRDLRDEIIMQAKRICESMDLQRT